MIQAIERYLELRKLLGYQDVDLSRDLRSFALFADDRKATFLREGDAIAWAEQKCKRRRRYYLLASVRRAGLWLNAEDPRHEILAEEHVRSARRARRPIPYIYTDGEIRRILAELGTLRLAHAYDAATYKHIVGLIAATGLRLNEARNILTRDFENNEIMIRRGKFGKDRIVHIHKSTVKALRTYLADRPNHLNKDKLFVIHNDRTPSGHSIDAMFRKCTTKMNLISRNGSKLPRIHDLRHTFAIRSLASCGSDRTLISNHMVALSTYLGHVSVASTYWYLEISTETKESMALAIEDVLDA
ncbi:tyrosine-type recombinase/integrase [Sphingomonas sp. ZB1N12]|uniref:tyrosine-type recombinase/integrase n=1 Tax=Sphingomonas arabinosi TaxID=3096160 RepID=UPI002FCAAF2C